MGRSSQGRRLLADGAHRAAADESPATKRVPTALRSCHSASLEGYNVEGHVPADVIKQLLKDRPKVVGHRGPGHARGFPGMESPAPQTYDDRGLRQREDVGVRDKGPQR